MRYTQPKYQTPPLPSAPEPTRWVSDASARRTKDTPSGQRVTPRGVSGHVFNELPPGADSAAAAMSDQSEPRLSMSDASDAAPVWGREAIDKGYRRLKVAPGCTEDVPLRTYDDLSVDGATAFSERGNLLDRI